MIKTVFFGSSNYSVIILQKLLELKQFEITAVVTKEDKPVGRNQTITPNPVAAFAKTNKLTLLQPTDFDQNFILEIKNLSAELALCVAYGPPFFTPELIDIFSKKIVNIHPSPLPKYRGATPGPWQIINGETQSAVSFFQIDELPDHGPLIAQLPLSISKTDTADSFYQKSFELAANNLESVLTSYIQNPTSLTPQDHSQKTYYPKLSKDNAQIDWSWEAQKIERFIRALLPWPVAWTYVADQNNKRLKMKVFSATLDSRLSALRLNSVQLEGKNPTHWSEIEKYYQIIRE